jgi:hypothetical protein
MAPVKKKEMYAPHAFEFNRDSRRMVCSLCGAGMNVEPISCPKGVVGFEQQKATVGAFDV